MLAFDIKKPLKPYVFLHGFMGCFSDWDKVRDFFPGSIAIDLPGHGKSNYQPSSDLFTCFSKRIKKIIDSLDLKKIHLIGYSLGGRIAMHFAMTYPYLISSLTIISAHTGYENIEERLIREKIDLQWINSIKKLSFTEFLDIWYKQPVFSTLRTKKLFLTMLERRKKQDPTNYCTILKELSVANQPLFITKLIKHHFPIKLICGENDSKYVSLYKYMKKKHPKILLCILKNAGHALHIEAPKNLAKAIVS